MLRLKILRQMLRLLATALMLLVGLDKLALAQTTVMPGPGGTPIAPGSPVTGYTPGGIGPGGVAISPGPAVRNLPMYRIGPGGVPLSARPAPLANSNNRM